MNNQWFQNLVPQYSDLGHLSLNYADMPNWWLESDVFDYAHDEPCSCAAEYIDSKIETPQFKVNMTMSKRLRGHYGPCTDELDEFQMTDTECYYYLRKYDAFDLSIENNAKDGCTECYAVGPNLWPLTEDQLIDTLTRSQGDNKDCIPKQGFHKSHWNEIYRCEEAESLNGIMAFTEANGDTDYECGLYQHFYLYDVIGNGYNMYPVLMVSFYSNDLKSRVQIVINKSRKISTQ